MKLAVSNNVVPMRKFDFRDDGTSSWDSLFCCTFIVCVPYPTRIVVGLWMVYRRQSWLVTSDLVEAVQAIHECNCQE